MAATHWSQSDLFKQYGKIVARKAGLVAVGWLLVYFLTQPMRAEPADGSPNILTLFGPVIGGIGGLVAGWYLATNAVEDSSMQGMTLWAILVLASAVPMWLVEGIMHTITRWPMNFGGFMVVTAGTLMALAAAVWHASSQE